MPFTNKENFKGIDFDHVTRVLMGGEWIDVGVYEKGNKVVSSFYLYKTQSTLTFDGTWMATWCMGPEEAGVTITCPVDKIEAVEERENL